MTFADKFRLKVMIVDGNATEHFWVIPFKRTATGFVGILANEPELVHRLRDVQENVEGRGGLHAPPIRLRLLNGSPLFGRFVSCPILRASAAVASVAPRSAIIGATCVS